MCNPWNIVKTWNILPAFFLLYFFLYLFIFNLNNIYFIYYSFLLCSFSFLVPYINPLSWFVVLVCCYCRITSRHNQHNKNTSFVYVAEKLLFVGVGLPCGLLVVSFRGCGRWCWFLFLWNERTTNITRWFSRRYGVL